MMNCAVLHFCPSLKESVYILHVYILVFTLCKYYPVSSGFLARRLINLRDIKILYLIKRLSSIIETLRI